MEKVIDIRTRKPLERIDIEDDTSALQFMQLMKNRVKQDEVQSIFVLTINKENFVNWGMVTSSEHHMLLAYATLDDLKHEIRDQIFPVLDDDGDDVDD